MCSVTGSLEQKVEGPKLTPFEQADYNLAKFVMSAQLHYELDVVIKRLNALEKMKKRFIAVLETSESVTLAFSTKSRIAEIDEEIAATEFVLNTLCETYDQEM